MAEADQSDVSRELSEQLRAGSPDALAEIYRRWAGLVHGIALRALANHHDAEDVTQQVFVAAWRARETLRPGPDALPGWLVGIARHRIADARTDRFRAARNTGAVAARLGPEIPATGDPTASLFVARELAALGEPRATVVRLALIDDTPHDEISRRLELPLGTVKSHVRRGLIELRRRMQEVDRVAP